MTKLTSNEELVAFAREELGAFDGYGRECIDDCETCEGVG
jgi:hypothetical protein